MKAKKVFEHLDEVSRAEDRWADEQIDIWQRKNVDVDSYDREVMIDDLSAGIQLIFNEAPPEILRNLELMIENVQEKYGPDIRKWPDIVLKDLLTYIREVEF
jgi:hypothetical protein